MKKLITLFILFLVCSKVFGQGKKISEYTEALPPYVGTEYFPVAKTGQNYKISLENLDEWIRSNIDSTDIPNFYAKVRALFGANSPISYNALTGKFTIDTTIVATRDYAENIGGSGSVDTTVVATRDYAENLIIDSLHTTVVSKLTANSPVTVTKEGKSYKVVLDTTIAATRDYAENIIIDSLHATIPSRVTANAPLSVTIEGKTYKLVLDTTSSSSGIPTKDWVENAITGLGSGTGNQYYIGDVTSSKPRVASDTATNKITITTDSLIIPYVKSTSGSTAPYVALLTDVTGQVLKSSPLNKGGIPYIDETTGQVTTSIGMTYDGNGYNMQFGAYEPIIFCTPTLQLGLGQVLNTTWPNTMGWYLFGADDVGASRSKSIAQVCPGTQWFEADSIMIGDWGPFNDDDYLSDSTNYFYVLDSLGKIGTHNKKSYWLSTDLTYIGDSARADTATRIVLYDTLAISYIRLDANEMYLGQDTINGPFLHLNKATSHTHLRGPEIRLESQTGHIEVQTDSVIFDHFDGANKRVAYLDEDGMLSVNSSFSYDPTDNFFVGFNGTYNLLINADINGNAGIGAVGIGNNTNISVADPTEFILMRSDSIRATAFAGSGASLLSANGAGLMSRASIYSFADTTIFATRDYAENQGSGGGSSSGAVHDVQLSNGSGGFIANPIGSTWSFDGDEFSCFGATGVGLYFKDTGDTLQIGATNIQLANLVDIGNNNGLVFANQNGYTSRQNISSATKTFLGTPSSSNLASAITDETGSGALVFGTSPTLTTPNLGTPSALTLTNATGLPITAGTTGNLDSSRTANIVTKVERKPGTDSVFTWKNNTKVFAFRDSIGSGGGGGSPGGSTNDVQINHSGSFYGDGTFTFDGDNLLIGSSAYAGGLISFLNANKEVIIGDVGGTNNGTRIHVDDDNEKITLTTLTGTGRAEVVADLNGTVTRGRQVIELVVSQSGTSDPTADLEINGTGATLTLDRTGTAGIYTITASSGIFDANTTVYFSGSSTNSATIFQAEITSSTVITFTSYNAELAGLYDDLLVKTGIMIRI